MQRVLRGLIAVLVVALAVAVGGCDLLTPSTTTTSTTTTSTSTTTTTEPPASWQQIQPGGESPSPRCYQAMVYDSTTGEIVMFGGVGATEALEETWSYDALANSWVELDVDSEDQPSATRQMPGAYDSTGLQVVSFDGTSWGLDVSAGVWGPLNPKGDKLVPARIGASMAKDEKSGKIILFGGTDLSRSYNETWSYDASSNTWTNLKPQGDVPAGRSDAGLAYDPVSGSIVLFGGVDSDFNCLDDTWLYDAAANTWTELMTEAAPTARSGLGFAYDRHSKQLVLFGGIDSQLVCYNDTWALDTAAGVWTDLSPTGYVPLARGRVSMVYVPAIDKLVVFGGATVQADESGGFGSLVYLNDMWEFGVHLEGSEGASGSTVETQVTTTTVPDATAGSTSTTVQ